MISRKDIILAIDSYLSLFPEAADRAAGMLRFASRYEGGALFDRHNPEGHFTASAIVCDADARNVLLLRHRTLGRWLQPGGHIEAADGSLLAAAEREVEEETGFTRGQYGLVMPPALRDIPGGRPVLFDLDSHGIPDSPAKGEGRHFHHDLRFLLRLSERGAEPRAADGESDEFRWVSVGALPRLFRRPDLEGALALFLQTGQENEAAP